MLLKDKSKRQQNIHNNQSIFWVAQVSKLPHLEIQNILCKEIVLKLWILLLSIMNLLKVNTAMITSEAVPNVFTTTGNTFSNRYNVMKGNFSQYSIKFVNELNKTRVKKICYIHQFIRLSPHKMASKYRN